MAVDMLIKNGHVIDPARGIDAVGDIAVQGNKIVLADEDARKNAKDTVDASGCYVLPGLIDFHTHGFCFLCNTLITNSCCTLKNILESVFLHRCICFSRCQPFLSF